MLQLSPKHAKACFLQIKIRTKIQTCDLFKLEAKPNPNQNQFKKLAPRSYTERKRENYNMVLQVGGGAVLRGRVADSKKKTPRTHFLFFCLSTKMIVQRIWKDKRREGRRESVWCFWVQYVTMSVCARLSANFVFNNQRKSEKPFALNPKFGIRFGVCGFPCGFVRGYFLFAPHILIVSIQIKWKINK